MTTADGTSEGDGMTDRVKIVMMALLAAAVALGLLAISRAVPAVGAFFAGWTIGTWVTRAATSVITASDWRWRK